MDKKCSVWWCERPYYSKGYCHTHWMANRRYHSPFGKHTEDINKLQAKIDDLSTKLTMTFRLIETIKEIWDDPSGETEIGKVIIDGLAEIKS